VRLYLLINLFPLNKQQKKKLPLFEFKIAQLAKKGSALLKLASSIILNDFSISHRNVKIYTHSLQYYMFLLKLKDIPVYRINVLFDI
jgi:hypothetical protein